MPGDAIHGGGRGSVTPRLRGVWGPEGGSRSCCPLPHLPLPAGGPWGIWKLLCCEEGCSGVGSGPPASPRRGQGEMKSLLEVLGPPLGLGAVCFPSLLYVALLSCGAGPPRAGGGTHTCAWVPPAPQPGGGGGWALFWVGLVLFLFGGKRNGTFPLWPRPTPSRRLLPTRCLGGWVFFFNLKKEKKG